ncbi:RNA polymerase sigma factor [Chitinophaga japonensis]|uniref:RNA polymerase sigma factor (Sigma-70 family) n=1 Tax=Chitinophaga japonensis TaxID=104662 RepID=A0A562TCJ9_CHIJA|nr:sigma-70 family RNA polymerase sigma factor [Chitinophaga japonensis]TWI91281.1 RNA polymerase sigma factor (sigma-70 family) [Chitinophaga japonensis]
MQEKEAQWLTTVYRDSFPQVARTVQQLGGDQETAKDLFHDALIIYLEKQRNHTLDIRVSLKAYLTGIVKILWIRKCKQDSRQRPLDNMEDQLGIPEDFYTPAPERTTRLLRYLQAAGSKCLQLLQAFYYEQRSMQEIARQFHFKTARSATVQKYKCLEKVREQVKNTREYEEAVA